ncbi:MAG: Coenzyme F420 hydrogenase/dehydrogenase, beta subunit C-terminal domain [Synergistaceae bacterium]|jgi:coenzyme F420-reducing hydrogenase beta subunit|nr:Coenzyme F420 hydrogenase/dehydrogenase, beta subunit C-terminal domain [Synergistaceae bacterium]
MRNDNFHVGDGICSGCGVCAAECPKKAIEMRETKTGHYKSWVDEELCIRCKKCVNVCAFSVSNIFTRRLEENQYSHIDGMRYSAECGFYLDSCVGFSEKYTQSSASGGLATWFLEAALQSGEVDAVVCAGSCENPDRLFDYRIITDPEELRRCSGSVYYPVEISGVLREIRASAEKVAVIALPCVITSIRNACKHDSKLKQNIKICAGLVCGYLAGKRMTHLVALFHGYSPEQIRAVRFRKKVDAGVNGNVQIIYTDGQQRIDDWNDPDSMLSLTFPYKIFTQFSCDCCDDIFARNADIVFMDTCGLPGYADLTFIQGLMSAVLVRSETAEKILRGSERDLRLFPFPVSEVAKTQRGRILQKHLRLTDRILRFQKQDLIDERIVPPFEHNPLTPAEARSEEVIARMRTEIDEFFNRESKIKEDLDCLVVRLRGLRAKLE